MVWWAVNGFVLLNTNEGKIWCKFCEKKLFGQDLHWSESFEFMFQTFCPIFDKIDIWQKNLHNLHLSD